MLLCIVHEQNVFEDDKRVTTFKFLKYILFILLKTLRNVERSRLSVGRPNMI